MFDKKLDTKVRSIIPKIRETSDGQIDQICLLGLQFEFTDEVAEGLGEVGVDALKHLKAGNQTSARIALRNIEVNANFTGGNGDKATIKKIEGVNVSAKRANKEDASPTLKATMAVPTNEKYLMFFVNHLEQTVQVKLDKVQLEIPGT